ncbi:MAG: hypothetical protein ACLTTU_03275 [Bilophila wadsworthia]
MRLPIIPAWFPLRALALQGVMALCVLLFCFAPLWYVTWKLGGHQILKPGYRQETLQPLMEGLNARREKPAPPQATKPCRRRTPAAHRHLAAEMVSLSGMQSFHFVPAAETVVERTASRLDSPFPPSFSGAAVLR